MTGPHTAAVGSYGGEAIDWLAERYVSRLRWFRRCGWRGRSSMTPLGDWWLDSLLTCSRQVGKSTVLLGPAIWRVNAAGRFGEERLILHTGKDLPVCKEVQRPARLWAKERRDLGYRVREQNGNEEISTPDGRRWIVRGKDRSSGLPRRWRSRTRRGVSCRAHVLEDAFRGLA